MAVDVLLEESHSSSEQPSPLTAAARASVHAFPSPCSVHVHTDLVPLPPLGEHSDEASVPLDRSCIEAPHIKARWLSMICSMRASRQYVASDLDDLEGHIEHGVRLLFDVNGPPPAKHYINSPSVHQHIDAVRSRLREYIDWGAVTEVQTINVTSDEHVHPLLAVVKPGKKVRICIDLSRNLNDFLNHIPFRYSTVTDAVRLSYPGCWYAKLDLSNCFLSFPLHPDTRPYLRFRLDGRLYQFERMPFGLASAPRICTQLLSVVAHELTCRGVTFVRYLDDFLFIAHDQAACQRMLSTALLVFANYGLVVNPDKTELPSQLITFLGIVLDSIQCTLSVTEGRCQELLQLMAEYRHIVSCTGHSLLSLIGKLSFAAQVMPGARPFMRRLLDAVHHHRAHRTVRLPPTFHIDLQFWQSRMLHWNRRCRWVTANPWILVSDASLQGFGFHCWTVPPHVDVASVPSHLLPGTGHYGDWSQCHTDYTDSHRKIGWCEMFSTLFAVVTYAPLLHNQSVILVLDNESDVAIINRQATRSDRIAVLLRALFDLCYRYNISVSSRHLAGVDNVLADFLSRSSLHRNDPLANWHNHLQSLTSVSVSIPDSSAAVPLLSLRSVTCVHSSQLELLELRDSEHMPSSLRRLCRMLPA